MVDTRLFLVAVTLLSGGWPRVVDASAGPHKNYGPAPVAVTSSSSSTPCTCQGGTTVTADPSQAMKPVAMKGRGPPAGTTPHKVYLPFPPAPVQVTSGNGPCPVTAAPRASPSPKPVAMKKPGPPARTTPHKNYEGYPPALVQVSNSASSCTPCPCKCTSPQQVKVLKPVAMKKPGPPAATIPHKNYEGYPPALVQVSNSASSCTPCPCKCTSPQQVKVLKPVAMKKPGPPAATIPHKNYEGYPPALVQVSSGADNCVSSVSSSDTVTVTFNPSPFPARPPKTVTKKKKKTQRKHKPSPCA